MIRFNLLAQVGHLTRHDQQRYQRWIGMLLISAALVVLGVWLATEQRRAQQSARVQRLQHAHQQKDHSIVQLKLVQQEIAQLGKQRAALEPLQQQRLATATLLTQLAVDTPAGIVLEQLGDDGRQLSIQGHADSHQDIVDLLTALRQRNPHGLVELRHATQSAALLTFLIEVVAVSEEQEQKQEQEQER